MNYSSLRPGDRKTCPLELADEMARAISLINSLAKGTALAHGTVSLGQVVKTCILKRSNWLSHNCNLLFFPGRIYDEVAERKWKKLSNKRMIKWENFSSKTWGPRSGRSNCTRLETVCLSTTEKCGRTTGVTRPNLEDGKPIILKRAHLPRGYDSYFNVFNKTTFKTSCLIKYED